MFEIANGTVIVSPENQQYRYGLTPPEAMLLKELHWQFSNGSPLGADWVRQPGCALTVETEEKPAEEGYFDQYRGKHIEARPAVPAKAHPRTNAEEIARLKKKYTGNLTKNGVGMTAFVAVFGAAAAVKLPETFAEIGDELGIVVHQEAPPNLRHDQQRAFELGRQSRPELAAIAVGHKLKIAPNDSKEFLIAAIINEENKSTEPVPVSVGGSAPANEPVAEVKIRKGKVD